MPTVEKFTSRPSTHDPLTEGQEEWGPLAPFEEWGPLQVERSKDKTSTASANPGTGGDDVTDTQVFTALGPLVVTTYAPRWCPGSRAVDTVRVCVDTAPTGADLLVRLKVNGTGQASTAVTVSAGANEGETVGAGLSIADGDYVQVEITQVGSTLPGSDMTVLVA